MILTVDRLLLIAVYIISIGALVLVPARRRREAHAVFLYQGLVTWILGLVVVEAGWIEYPVREMQTGTRTSLVFEYFSYPIVSAYFNLYYPKGKALFVQIVYYVLFVAGLTVPEYFIEKYTDLIKYHGWQWYWTVSSLLITLFLSRLFYIWCFRPDFMRRV